MRPIPAVLALAVAAGVGTGLGLLFRPGLRRDIAPTGIGLVAVGLASIAPNLVTLAMLVLVLAALQARLRAGALPYAAPVLAAGLLVVAAMAAQSEGSGARLAAVAAALGIAATAGVLPHLLPEGASERPAAAGLAWTALMAPALVVAIVVRTEAVLPAPGLRVFGGVLMGIGSLNLLWGLGVTLTREGAWRASLLSEWGFALIALGLLSADGSAAGYLFLMAVLLLRLPILLEGGERAGLVTGFALGGSPPFLGFTARVLLLRAATAAAWPLAVALAVAMLLALPAALRLVSAGPGTRRLRSAQALLLAVNAVAGLYPVALLRPAGLG